MLLPIARARRLPRTRTGRPTDGKAAPRMEILVSLHPWGNGLFPDFAFDLSGRRAMLPCLNGTMGPVAPEPSAESWQ